MVVQVHELPWKLRLIPLKEYERELAASEDLELLV